MDWSSPKGILRKGMSLERDGYKFYKQVADRASDERGKAMFMDLAHQEVDHLRLLLAEYRALEAGEDWLSHDEAMAKEFDLNPDDPDLPGEEPDETLPVFTPDRKPSLEGDLEALKFGMKTEDITRDLYAQGAKDADNADLKEAYRFLVGQEERHYELLQRTHEYLSQNGTWWDSDEYPFFIG